MEHNQNIIFPKWFTELSAIGSNLANYHEKKFVACICLPTLKFSIPAILIGLIKKYLEIEIQNKTIIKTLSNLSEGETIKFHDFNDKIFYAKFISLELLYGEQMVRLKIQNEKREYEQIIPIKKGISRVFIFRENEQNNAKIYKEIKNSYTGFENIYLSNEEINELKTSHSSKILIVGQKKLLLDELVNFNIGYDNFESKNDINLLEVRYERSKSLGIFNDVIRVKDFVSEGESYISSIESPLTSKKLDISEKIIFKIYLGSNSFLRFQEDDSVNNNSIILLSPSENNFENSINLFNNRHSIRNYIDHENFTDLKKLNFHYPAMIFREN